MFQRLAVSNDHMTRTSRSMRVISNCQSSAGQPHVSDGFAIDATSLKGLHYFCYINRDEL